ncbi:MAG: 3-deoxy-8-phosphooctulonate synthase [Candidatus Wallbacteria bacterium HGW-Wallbacteria-1]|jgi:2-dehydro-3-deoxyphosphooctonate aldolase (KDO 8-P synthase)|uniref:2-dehydro-3-deoxyphosphooctonate aldolase n=1 Tax=Candidatus Wallbacteria bacterium HGW-Wallbacteria-1 TaxID=2013854 RepID=A0A2N1PT26_9BACT|nr:MAG: 3-deoxy-8-phosphooctulonate synthase [Candidatus Wallbacteria bacterium HGW-Wallbacteria-1]
MRDIKVGEITIGKGRLALIAGPCVIEGRDHTFRMAEKIGEVCVKRGLDFIFKTSYDKANRSSVDSYRGPGLDGGLEILAAVKKRFGCPILVDIHSEDEIEPAAEVADILQIPAFLCRQTDFVQAVARSGRVVNVKKGQFLAPWDMANVIAKIEATGCHDILLTERGVSFGYNNLVVDYRSLPVLAGMGYPVIFDATHSVQLPGGLGKATGGNSEYVPHLSRAAVAVGVQALFMEVHDDPSRALCDGPNQLPLSKLPGLLEQLLAIAAAVQDHSLTES